MTKPLVIGFGDPRRRDNALGPLAAERLQRLFRETMEVISCGLLSLDLARPIADSGGLVLFLGAQRGLPPGGVACREVQPHRTWHAPEGRGILSPEEALLAASALARHAPQAYLIGGGGLDFSPGFGLSAKAEQALERMVAASAGLLTERRLPGVLLSSLSR